MNTNAIGLYQQMIKDADIQLKKYDRLINTYSFLRLFALAAGGTAIWQAVTHEDIWLTELAFFALVIVFAWLVKRQSACTKKKEFYTAFRRVNANELTNTSSYENLYDEGSGFVNDRHPYTSDLDVFGRSSLFYFVNRCATPAGNVQLAQWLENPAPDADIRQRQEAVKELAAKTEWMKQFQAVLLFAKEVNNREDVVRLLKYLELIPAERKGWLSVYVKYVPWAFLLITVAGWFWIPLLLLLFIPGLLNIFLVLSHQPDVGRVERMTGKAGHTLSGYADAFSLLEKEAWQSGLSKRLHEALVSQDNVSFSGEVKRLSSLLDKLEYRMNGFIGPLLNIAMAWDVRQLLAIEAWSRANRPLVKQAFEVIASFESLISLAVLHGNHPEWCFPEIVGSEHYTLTVTSAGHPLIRSEVRVVNDFSLENTHKIDIVTGSNMAGKSTFLRTLGVNIVLALCGAPVCATRMRLTNMQVFSYMRIKDSLNESISTFKAELNRLQLLLDVLRSGNKVYFLIDEMLRGTNSADKYRGSKAVIEKLIAQGSVGIVATHDLQIAELESAYPDYVRNFYFDIQVRENEMLFDYKLKEGACKTFNASMLLRQLGIEIGEEIQG